MESRQRRLLLAAAGSTLIAGLTGALTAWSQPTERLIKVRARKFTYDPDEITVTLNEPVVLELTSEDVVMGINIPDFAARSDIIPGQTHRLRFVPDKAGTFEFHCDIFCGTGHEDMSGTLHVE